MANHITKLVLDNSQFDPQMGQAIRFVQLLDKNIADLKNGMLGLSSGQRSMLATMGQIKPASKNAAVAFEQLKYLAQKLEKTYNQMDIHTKISQEGKLISRAMLDVKKSADAARESMEKMQETAKKPYTAPTTNVSTPNAGAEGGNGIGAFGVTKGMIGYKALMEAVKLGERAVKYAVSTNMEFEQSNANLAAILGTTRSEITGLTEQAKQLGATTIYTANQVTGLQTELARLGFTQIQIQAMTKDVTSLAAATGTELSNAASLAGSTLRAFNLPATEMDRVASALAVSTTKCALTTEKLATGLPYVSAAAKQFGFSLEDVLALMGTLADSGFQATTAGVAVRNIMRALSNDSSKLSKVMGMPVKTLDDFVAGLKKMKEEGANLGDIASIIEVRVSPALSRFADGADRVKELREQLHDCREEMQGMVDEQMNTLQGSVTLMTSAWDGLMLSFANGTGIIKDVVDMLTGLVNEIRKARTLANGGKGAEDLYKGNVDIEAVRRDIELDRKNGRTEDEIFDWHKKKLDSQTKERDSLRAHVKELENINKQISQFRGPIPKYLQDKYNAEFDAIRAFGAKSINDAYKKLGAYNTNIEKQQAYLDVLDEKNVTEQNAPGEGAGYRDRFSSKNNTHTSTHTPAATHKETPKEKANKLVAEAEARYAEEVAEATEKLKAKLITQAEYDKRIVKLDEGMFEAYGKANRIFESKKFQSKQAEWLEAIGRDAKTAFGSEISKEIVDAKRKYAAAYSLAAMKEKQDLQDSIAANKQRLNAEEQLWSKYYELYQKTEDKQYVAEMERLSGVIRDLRSTIEAEEDALREKQQRKAIDNRTLNSIMQMARSNKIAYSDIGLSGMKERIDAKDYFDIPDSDWYKIVDELNKKLKENGVKWTVELDVETGTLQKTEEELKKFFDRWSSGIGAVDSIVGALDNIKKAGVSAKEAIEGDGDAWDKMMALFNAALAPLEAVVTIYEAVNTLMAISSALKDKDTVSTVAHATAEGADAEASGALAGTEVAQTAANEALAISSISAANAMMAEANAAKAAEYALMPGGIAALPGVLAALNGAYAGGLGAAKAASAIMYAADGGMAGNPLFKPRGTDTVPAMLSPGEIILNKAQQTNVAAQLQPSRVLSGGYGGHVTFEIDGRKLIGTINNEIAATGGGRAHRIYSH